MAFWADPQIWSGQCTTHVLARIVPLLSASPGECGVLCRDTALPAPAPREPDVKPMDLDRNRARNTGPRPRKCFDCGQEGHFRGDARCPHQARVLAEAVRAVLADLKVTVPGVPPTPETTSSTSGTSAGVFEEARE